MRIKLVRQDSFQTPHPYLHMCIVNIEDAGPTGMVSKRTVQEGINILGAIEG